jgi:hypothetical protein
MLSFEEFKQVNKREQSKTQLGQQTIVESAAATSRTTSASSAAQPDDSSSTTAASGRKFLGDFLELHSMQSFYITLLVLDTFGAFAEIALSANPVANQLFPILTSQAVRGLRLFSKLNLVFFSVEILLVYVAFGLNTVTHFGYMSDVLVITAQLTLDYYGVGRINRLLNLLRVWRPIRLLAGLVQLERLEKEALQQKLAEKDDIIRTNVTELENAGVELSKEKGARESIESMLQNYKEEVDTLNEALKIAAMDIAEVAQTDDDFLDTDDDDEGEDDQVTLSSKAESSAHSKVSKLRAVLGDNISAEANKPSTFVIREDGGFERR